jgi:hypothetical protein
MRLLLVSGISIAAKFDVGQGFAGELRTGHRAQGFAVWSTTGQEILMKKVSKVSSLQVWSINQNAVGIFLRTDGR